MFSGVPYRLAAALLLILTFVQTAVSQEPKLQQLLQRSPQPVNAVSYLHTPSLKKLLADAKISMELADKVEEVWLVANLDTDRLQPNWEAGFATIKQLLEVEDLAKQLGGFVDIIGTQKAIRTPKQSYIVPFGQDRVAFLRPAKRKLLTDWLGGTAGHVAPAYLAAQSKQPEQYLSLMVAVDLQDTFSPVDLVSRLGTFESLKGQDIQVVADLLSTGYRAKWDEQQARRIDEIGTLNVDPQMIEYGANVSSILRGNSIAIRTGNVAAGQVQAAQSALGGIGYDGEYYGGYYGTRDRAITGAQQRMGAGGSYRQAISMIDQLTGDVRRAMTDKFSIQF